MLLDLNQLTYTLVWMIPLWLIIMLVFQIVYLLVVRVLPTRSEERPPAQPIMPAIYGRETAPQPAYAQPQYAPQPQQPMQPIMPAQYGQQPMPQQAMPTPYPQPTPYQQPMQPTPYPPAPQQAPQIIPSQPTPYAPQPAPTGMGGMGKFVIMSGLEGPKEIAFPAATFAVGRFYSPENGVLVAVDEKSISRKHAVFTADEGVREYYIKDTNSSFGTSIMIGGVFEALTAEKQERIYNEDIIQFGNAVTARVILPTETRATMTIL